MKSSLCLNLKLIQCLNKRCILTNLIMTDSDFKLFQSMIYDVAGINISCGRKNLVKGRLAKRVRHYSLSSYRDYFNLLEDSKLNELQIAVDLLTTNETYFFREVKHFNFLYDEVLPKWHPFSNRRIWSAASSSGEEAYSLAMLLAEHSPTDRWEVIGSDISKRMIERAKSGIYDIERMEKIPKKYLTKYCLKGVGEKDGTFSMIPFFKEKVSFHYGNLKNNQIEKGDFDIIFLRNVLIYFDMKTKQNVVDNLLLRLKSGGYFIIGHSENLTGIKHDLTLFQPSIYVKS